ncbi:MAG: fumarylacetoacetate hydrolase family protein [Acidimicrobiales bacterium]
MKHPLVATPSKIIAVHLNYASRAAERGRTPACASYFLKPPSSLSSTDRDVVRPAGCELLNFEGEIALVIGQKAQRVGLPDAPGYISHYVAANDFGVYDLRHADLGSNLRSKGQDGFTPLGPTLIEANGSRAAHLRLRTWVNGVLAQDATTDELIFGFDYLVADLSRLVTLEPGDIILTGTPAGSRPVQPGDVVEVEIGDTGRLRNTIAQADHDLQGPGAMPELTSELRSAALGAGAPGRSEVTRPTGNTEEVEIAGISTQTVEHLRKVSTATLCSQLRKRGIENCFIEGARPARGDLHMVGTARTLRYLPLREDLFAERGGGMNAQKRAIETLSPGEVLVIAARGDDGAGTIGDLLALRAMRRGAAGIVSDGPVRDVAGVTSLDMPIYHAGSHGAVLGRRHTPFDADLPICCGGVLVMPGDVLVGDADGVVVIPAHLSGQIGRDALAQELEERFIYERVQAGASIEGLFPMDAEQRSDYEAWLAELDSKEKH